MGSQRRALGTLCGVAAPSLQTLLGLLLVLRLPWAVGSGGVLQVCGVGVLLGACVSLFYGVFIGSGFFGVRTGGFGVTVGGFGERKWGSGGSGVGVLLGVCVRVIGPL